MNARLVALAVLLAGCPGPSRIEGTEPGDCSDGADNDADGAFDCDDSSCTGAPVCRGALDGGMEIRFDAPILDDSAAVPDAPPPGSACVPYAAELEAGLADSLQRAVNECAVGPCASCTFAGGRGAACGPGGTLTSCVVDCITTPDVGPCQTDGSCDTTGATCDVPSGRCLRDSATMVTAAIAEGRLDVECGGCYAGIIDCAAASSCLVDCASPGCPCDSCQCEALCDQAFVACSGLPAYLDCDDVRARCGP